MTVILASVSVSIHSVWVLAFSLVFFHQGLLAASHRTTQMCTNHSPRQCHQHEVSNPSTPTESDERRNLFPVSIRCDRSGSEVKGTVWLGCFEHWPIIRERLRRMENPVCPALSYPLLPSLFPSIF